MTCFSNNIRHSVTHGIIWASSHIRMYMFLFDFHIILSRDVRFEEIVDSRPGWIMDMSCTGVCGFVTTPARYRLTVTARDVAFRSMVTDIILLTLRFFFVSSPTDLDCSAVIRRSEITGVCVTTLSSSAVSVVTPCAICIRCGRLSWSVTGIFPDPLWTSFSVSYER